MPANSSFQSYILHAEWHESGYGQRSMYTDTWKLRIPVSLGREYMITRFR